MRWIRMKLKTMSLLFPLMMIPRRVIYQLINKLGFLCHKSYTYLS